MINVLYVGGDNISLLNGSSDQVNIDYVQNGMIALTAVQTSDFDAVIVEDKLPLMTPSRLIRELFKANTTIPIISLVRSDARRKTLLTDVGMGLFGYFEPEYSKEDVLVDLLKLAKDFMILRNRFLK